MLRKIPFETSAPILQRFALTDEARAVAPPELDPEAALAALDKGKHMVDLINYFAHGMPPREGICWAVIVIRDIRADIAGHDAEVLAICEKWVKDPQESLRNRLMDEAETRLSDDPIGWLCNAVVWNGSGSMGPKEGPVVLPPVGLHASALLGAVALLAGKTEESLIAVRQSAYRWGMEVAKGGWPMRCNNIPNRS